MTDIEKAAASLAGLCERVSTMLEGMDEGVFSRVPAPGKWSKKQILGHLIDSAANNHQRFVRIQYETEPRIGYDQDRWVSLQDYQSADSRELIRLWTSYNKHLAHLIKHIPPDNLDRKGFSPPQSQHTLHWYITDYVAHLEHHLKQILGEKFVPSLTPNPYD